MGRGDPVKIPANGPKVFRSVNAIATHYGVHVNSVRAWWRHKIPCPGEKPKDGKGAWKRAEFDQWISAGQRYREFEAKTNRANSEYASLDLRQAHAKTKKEEANAKTAAVRARLADPRFASAREVNQFLGEFFSDLRKNVQAIPSDMSAAYPEGIREKIRLDLENRGQLLLNQLADWVARFNDSKEIDDRLDDGLGDKNDS